VTLLDANILIYAYNEATPKHHAAKEWIADLFSDEGWVGIPWVTIWAFLRITTNPRAMQSPFSTQQALEIVNTWIALPNVILVEPGVRHIDILESMVTKGQASGPLLTDAVLAALAIEQGAVFASTDRDFGRFPGLSWINPLQD